MDRNVMIAGLGALGGALALNLGKLRLPVIVLIDPDRLETKNIARSVLWRDARPGEWKVEAAARALQRQFPETLWIPIPTEVADAPPDRLQATTLMLGAVDTDLARLEMAAICARHAIDMCDGGLGGTSVHVGRVSWFPYTPDRSAACFSCLLTMRRRAALLGTWEAQLHACDAEAPHAMETWLSTASTVERIARLQAFCAARALRDPSRSGALTLQVDLPASPRLRLVRHRASGDCPFHDEDVLRGDLFARCEAAECAQCGYRVDESVRVGWLRRRGRCTMCGAALQPIQSAPFATQQQASMHAAHE